MALQGTIDAFPLVDVVQLLGTSRKTGRLTVDGDRGTGRIWVVDGELVAAEHRGSAVDDGVVALAELLRPATGAFVFDPGEEVAEAALVPVPLLELLVEASSVLEEWRAIEAVVPSSMHRPFAVPELPDGADPVTLDSRDWQLVVAAAHGSTAGELAELLGLDELEVGRAVVAMVERGLLYVAEPHDGGTEQTDDAVDAAEDGEPVLPVELVEEEPEEASFPDHFPIDDLVSAGDAEDPWSTLEGDEDRFAAAQPFAEPGYGAAAPAPAPSAFSDPAPFDGTPFDGTAFDGTAFDGNAFDAPFDGTAFDAPFDGTAFDGTAAPEGQAPSAFEAPAFDSPAFESPALDSPAFESPAFEAPAFGATAFEPALEPEALAVRAFEPMSPADAMSPEDRDPGVADAAEEPRGPAEEVDGTEEILRQMSRLSPKAADAIAAALGSAADASTDGPDADSPDAP